MTMAIAPDVAPGRKTATLKKALLLTATAPGEPGVGGVILKDMIQLTGVEDWHCCWLASKHGPQDAYWKELPTTVHRRQFETGYRPVRGIAGEMISTVALRVCRFRMINSMVQTLTRLCQETQPDFVLAVLDTPAVIEAAHRFQQKSRVPVRSLVWDDVDVFCRQCQFDRWTERRIKHALADVLKRSERVAVICENMQTEYHRRYGIDSLILRHGVAPLETTAATTDKGANDVYRIGFAGSNTAPDCLRVLIDGLDSMQWTIGGREVVLRLLGARYLLDSRRPQRIEYFGWRSVAETCQRLSECDVLYLPQSFTPENRSFSELSFPTKLSTYVTARRPILLHAPQYASLTSFWQRHSLGPHCDQCDVHAIRARMTEALLAEKTERDEWLAAIAHAHEQSLGVRQFAAGTEQLLSRLS